MLSRTAILLVAASCALLSAESYKDPKSGLQVTEIDPPLATAQNLYFHFSNFTADNRNIIFASADGDTSQIYRYDLESGKATAVTSGPGVAAASACPHPKDPRILYYPRGRSIEEIDLTSGKVRKVGELPQPSIGGPGQPTLSHDLKSLALVRQRDESNWEVGLMDIATGAWKPVATVGFRVGHVQHHPSEPMIFYVWETGGYAPQRTWVVNDDGTANRPFYHTADQKQWVTPLKEWVTHESWVSGTGDMVLVMDKIGLVIADKTGKGRILPGNYWHVAARTDGRYLVADDFDGNLYLIDPSTDSRRLLASGLRQTVRPVHAHASFDRTGRYVLFNTGRTRQTIATVDLLQIGGYTLP